MADATYTQPKKAAARRAALGHAIDVLTEHRAKATCVPEHYVRSVRDELLRQGGRDAELASLVSDERIISWELFHRAKVGARSPNDLTVCYLCGPEPLNDVEVLVDMGIHPHNIWAFESEGEPYAQALASAQAHFPMLKIYHGKIEAFFESSQQRFDIIYLDACGPLPSSNQNTLRLVATALRHQRLASPGALVTNFSLPDEEDKGRFEAFSQFVATYLYPKAFLEHLHDDNSPGAIEGPIAYGLLLDRRDLADHEGEGEEKLFVDVVRGALPTYYGQFVTRQLMDLSSIVVPWLRLTTSPYWKRFFCKTTDEVSSLAEKMIVFDEDGDGGDVVVEAEEFPLQWTARSLLGGLEGRDPAANMQAFAEDWLNQLAGLPQPKGKRPALKAIECFDVTRTNHNVHSPELKAALDLNFRRMHQFCDVPSWTLLFDLIAKQLVYPMHYVTDAIRRWQYTAKSTPMFLDVLVLEECRYIYDWLPMANLTREAFSDLGQHLTYRFALDGLAKNRRWYNSEFFFGAAVIDQGREGFEAKVLESRLSL